MTPRASRHYGLAHLKKGISVALLREVCYDLDDLNLKFNFNNRKWE